MSENPLAALKIDSWYKILPAIGTVTLILGLTVEVKSVENVFVQLISVGVIFVGIGEWINHPLQTKVGGNFKITSYNRLNTVAGSLWDLAGIGVVAYAFIFHS